MKTFTRPIFRTVPTFLTAFLGLTASSAALQVNPCQDTITFELLPAGLQPAQVFGQNGIGPIGVKGTHPLLGGGVPNAAVVFDSSAPTGGDPDLGSPNETFGGPGIGLAGELGSPFQNAVALGKILVLAENLVDANNDGLVDDPDDANVVNASIEFDFTALGSVYIEQITMIDIETTQNPTRFRLFDPQGAMLQTVFLPRPGNNGVATVTINNGPVARAVLFIEGSGGYDNLRFQVWKDCNANGVLDSIDVGSGASADCNGDFVPDECQPDCDADGLIDACEADCNMDGTPDDCQAFVDCNSNGIPDECDIADGKNDCDGNGIPDSCDPDCDSDGVPDTCEPDCDVDGIPDDCEADCDGDSLPDDCEDDCNANGTPDDCEGSTSTTRNGTDVNPVSYTQVTPPAIGTNWLLAVDLAGNTASIVAISLTGPTPGVLLNGAIQGELLGLPPFATDADFGNHSIPIPGSCSLIGLSFTTLGAVFSPGTVTLYNAIDIVVGTF